jgi:hypothetical protein
MPAAADSKRPPEKEPTTKPRDQPVVALIDAAATGSE